MRKITPFLLCLMVLCLCMALFACNYAEKIELKEIEGNVANVTIDVGNHTASCDVDNETATFELSQLVFSSNDVSVSVYADADCAQPLSDMILQEGANTFYVSVSFKKASAVYTLVVTRHVHTFAEEWSFDNDYHWHAATCGHTELSADKGVHTWIDGEITVVATETVEGQMLQTCAVCGRTRTVTTDVAEHVHTYDTEHWTSDDDFHWHAATCGHSDLNIDKAAHTWSEPTLLDGNKRVYTCTVCGRKKAEGIEILSSYTVEFWGYEEDEYKLLGVETVAGHQDCTFDYYSEERDGYDFVGWTHATYNNNTYNYTITATDILLYNVSGKVTVNAQYVQQCLVIFADYNGNAFKRVKADVGSTIQAPEETPTRYGYIFEGWNYDFTTPVLGDTTINAKYVKSYVVTFVGQDGKVLDSKTVRTGTAATYDAPKIECYAFEYWTDGTVDENKKLVDVSASLESVEKDMQVTAVYKLIGYKVRFFAKDSLVEEQFVNPYGFAVAPELTSQYLYTFNWTKYTGYAFSGWDADYSFVTQDIDVHAKYETPIASDTPIIAVKTDRYKNIVAEDIEGAMSVNVSFVLVYDQNIRGLTIGVRQNNGLLVYDSFTLFPETQSLPAGNTEYTITKDTDEAGDGELHYCEDITWSSNSGGALVISQKKEILRITYKINGIDAAMNYGEYWIVLDDNTFIVNDDLSRLSPILISDYVRIVPTGEADE